MSERRWQLERHFERREDELEGLLRSGRISDREYDEGMSELREEERDAFREAYDADFDDAMRSVEEGWW